MIDFALGELGLKPWEFWELTWAEYDSMCRGYFVRVERQHWDPMRHMIATFINVNRGKGQPVIKPERLYPLSFDKKPEAAKPYSKEEMQDVLARRGFQKKPDGKWKQQLGKKTEIKWQQLLNSQ